MKRLYRPALSARAIRFLAGRSGRVRAAPDQQAMVRRLWKLRNNAAFWEVSSALRGMAGGIERCCYCEDSAGSDIDHFRPKLAYPEHAFDWLNYLLACSVCNSNFKRDSFPLDANGIPLLIDPSIDEPADHLAFSFLTGNLVGLTTKGAESIRVFGLARDVLVTGRRDAWIALKVLLNKYFNTKQVGNDAECAVLAGVVQRRPYASLLAFTLRAALQPGAPAILGEDIVAILQGCPEIAQW